MDMYVDSSAGRLRLTAAIASVEASMQFPVVRPMNLIDPARD